MLSLFRHLSIRSKLTLVVLFSCVILLVIACSILLVGELYSGRAALTREIRTLASSLAVNSRRALVLEQLDRLTDILRSLQPQTNIHAAYLFDRQGRPVAEYLNPKNPQFVLEFISKDFVPEQEDLWLNAREKGLFDLSHLGYFYPVSYAGQNVGSLYLLSDLSPLYVRLYGVVFGVIGSFLFLVFCSLVLARWLQKPISVPLLDLTQVMNEVSSSKNYALRAGKINQDEIGLLVDGFNQMLEQIEQQQSRLTRHQQQLERIVAERTADLRLTVNELEKARHQADAANQAKSDFLSKMTHELKTPLIGVLGMNELLQRSQLDSDQLLLTETVRKSGEQLLHLINDILDLSRIEAGKLSLAPAPVDVSRIIDDVACLLSPQAREKELTLIVDIPLDCTGTVVADGGRLRQIVTNLVANAIKFTPFGEVRVGLRRARAGKASKILILFVEDTGIGMDDGVRGQVFEMFYQADNTDTGTAGGTGLGLAIVRQLVELMGAKLSLTSAPGKGSRFEILTRFPTVEKSHYELPRELAGRTVLLCCGTGPAVTVLESRLQELGFEVDVAAGAAEVFYLLNSAGRRGISYAFLFLDTDVSLPGGEILYLRLRHVGRHLPVKKILLSDQEKNIDLADNETRLTLPLSWPELHGAICRGWTRLHLLDGRQKTGTQAPTADAAPVFLLLAHHAAAAELLRRELARFAVEAKVFTSLQAVTEALNKGRFCGLLIDDSVVFDAQLIDFLDQYQRICAPVVVLTEAPEDSHLSIPADHRLRKPFKAPDVERILRPARGPAILKGSGERGTIADGK